LQRGWHVKGVDKGTYAANLTLLKEFNEYKNFSFINCDINELTFLYECDYVINTAAETHVGNSIVDSKDFVKSNIDGVHNLLELIKNYRHETNVKPTLLHFSTDEVYGDINNGSHTETDLLKPSNPYSATKAAADMLILAWNRTYNSNYIIVRPTNNYGCGQYVEKLIPKTLKYLGLGRKIQLHEGGTPVRNWLHAEDTASAVMQIIDSGVRNDIFNIAGGFEQSNIDTVKQIIQNYFGTLDNYEQYLDLSYNRPGMDTRYALNDDKLRSIGWEPKKRFEIEIANIVEYYKERFIW
jgi:dTDP-glucose 4,6-dehydratase